MSICFLVFLDLLPKYFNRTHFAKEWRRWFQTWKLDVPILCAYIEWKREGNINYQKAWIVDIINTCLFLFMFDKRCQRSLTQDVIATWSWWWKAQERQQDSGYAGHWLPRNDSGPYPAGWISDCPGPGDGQQMGYGTVMAMAEGKTLADGSLWGAGNGQTNLQGKRCV